MVLCFEIYNSDLILRTLGPSSNTKLTLVTIATSLVGMPTKMAHHVYKQKSRIVEQNSFPPNFVRFNMMPKILKLSERNSKTVLERGVDLSTQQATSSPCMYFLLSPTYTRLHQFLPDESVKQRYRTF